MEIIRDVAISNLPPTSACPKSHTDADDCGEAIHLLGVSSSKVIGNKISHNVNGVAFNSNITHVGHNQFANVINHYLRYTPPAS